MENWLLEPDVTEDEAFEFLCDCIDEDMLQTYKVLMAEWDADDIANEEAQEIIAAV